MTASLADLGTPSRPAEPRRHPSGDRNADPINVSTTQDPEVFLRMVNPVGGNGDIATACSALRLKNRLA